MTTTTRQLTLDTPVDGFHVGLRLNLALRVHPEQARGFAHRILPGLRAGTAPLDVFVETMHTVDHAVDVIVAVEFVDVHGNGERAAITALKQLLVNSRRFHPRLSTSAAHPASPAVTAERAPIGAAS